MSKLNEKTNFELNVLVAMHENTDLVHATDGGVLAHEDGTAEFWLPTPDGNDAHAGKYNYTGDWGDAGFLIEHLNELGFIVTLADQYAGMENVNTKMYHEGFSAKDRPALECLAIIYLEKKGES